MKLQRCDTDSEDDDAGRRPSATSKNAIKKRERLISGGSIMANK